MNLINKAIYKINCQMNQLKKWKITNKKLINWN